ncbi:hypothetical protein PSTG_02751 [Puccinia striiformis f. sp. tritici PST-78]|uniref:Uncharacterized protein n=1 Tax=Puccinia striiformis f. sp. tritici PST-78 TaxID=1165861 RepID=A0A0L0VXQ2_9BASI|nr:hypothetical protein PSTG_02751 [Puccinia striiformis f. sp. tritici PST-78]
MRIGLGAPYQPRTPSSIKSVQSQPPQSPCSTPDRPHHSAPAPGLLKLIMKCSIITATLCGAAFASIIGAMNVVIDGKDVKPTIPEDGDIPVMAGPEACGFCKGEGC